MITRKQYMDGNATHTEYYRELALASGVVYSPSSEFVGRVRLALHSGDEHLNTIPLHTWDLRAMGHGISRKPFTDRGDFPSLAGLVCLHKAAARLAAAVTIDD